MENTILSRLYECIDNFWKYYLKLEDDLLQTERYLTIHNDNKKAFSIAYLQLYLSIGSEIDVIAKELCKVLDGSFDGDKIQHYCKVITQYYPNFKQETIGVFSRDYDSITPWTPWDFTEGVNKNGKSYVTSSAVPSWWRHYNKIKHDRMGTNGSSNKKNYQFANQENLISALAGLYLLEMYYYTELLKKCKNTYGQIISKDDFLWISESKLFGISSLKTSPSGIAVFNDCDFCFYENC